MRIRHDQTLIGNQLTAMGFLSNGSACGVETEAEELAFNKCSGTSYGKPANSGSAREHHQSSLLAHDVRHG